MNERDKRVAPDYASGNAEEIRAQVLAYRKPTGPVEAAEWQKAQAEHLQRLGQATVEITPLDAA